MNILPLISAFILIFAIGSYTFVHNLLSSIQEQQHFYGAMQLSHAYERKLQAKHWGKIGGENLIQSTSTANEPKETHYSSPRDKKYPYPEAKLNVFLLAKEKNAKLETIFLDLIEEIYAYAPFNSSDIGPLLLMLIKQAKELSSLDDLISFAPKEDRELIYKLLKGTQNINEAEGKGYPPLTDYIRFEKDKAIPIRFCHATHPLLKVLFGKDIANEIIGEEEKKWKPKHKHEPLTKQELETLLLSNNLNLSSIEELLDFIKSKEPLKEEVIEQQNIQVRRKL